MYTRPHHERKVSMQLLEKNIDYFLPTVQVLDENSKGLIFREKPVFTSYVFVYVEQWQTFHESSRVDGYIRYIKFGEEIVMVSEDVIKHLKLITEHGSWMKIFRRQFVQGQQSTIQRGPLSGMSCKFVKQNNSRTITVNIHLLGTDVSAVIPANYLNHTG
jgi:transcriptional antiterminator RfaH